MATFFSFPQQQAEESTLSAEEKAGAGSILNVPDFIFEAIS